MSSQKPQDRVSGRSFKLSLNTSESVRLVTVEPPQRSHEREAQETFILRLFHDDVDPEQVDFIDERRGLIEAPDPITKLEAEAFNKRLKPLQKTDTDVYWVRPQVEYFSREGVVYSEHKIDVYVPVDSRERWIEERVSRIATHLDAVRERTLRLRTRRIF